MFGLNFEHGNEGASSDRHLWTRHTKSLYRLFSRVVQPRALSSGSLLYSSWRLSLDDSQGVLLYPFHTVSQHDTTNNDRDRAIRGVPTLSNLSDLSVGQIHTNNHFYTTNNDRDRAIRGVPTLSNLSDLSVGQIHTSNHFYFLYLIFFFENKFVLYMYQLYKNIAILIANINLSRRNLPLESTASGY